MANAVSRFYSAEDGLRLHYRDFPAADDGDRRPVVCLPGLGRTTDDFEPLATFLSVRSASPRRVLAFDYRGRGLSDHDPDWRHYDLPTERRDVLTALSALGIERAHFVGTSRGGLHVMALAATEHRDLIDAVVLNDIGPVLEPAGLRRIKGYIGKPVCPRTIEDAIALLKGGAGQHFDGLSDDEWRHFAETTFGTDPTALGLRYDPELRHALDGLDPDEPIPDAWSLFDLLRGSPVLTIRGANSDLLSQVTLDAMRTRWPGNLGLTVPGQGHAPLLADLATISEIDRFLTGADARPLNEQHRIDRPNI